MKTKLLSHVALLPAAALTLAGPASGQSLGYFSHDYQVPVTERATFNVSGAATLGDVQGDAFLSSVVYLDDSEFTEYYTPVNISHFLGEAGKGKKLAIRGGNNITEGISGLHFVGGYAEGRRSDQITEADIEKFEASLRKVMANKNLNNYFDVAGGTHGFDFIMSFELPVMDDDPTQADVRGELLYFERGTGGGNSWLTLQAVDEDGNALGPAIAISPQETFPTSPIFSVMRSDQKLGGLAIDVSRLGVSEVQHLRVRKTETTDDGYGPISRGGVDFNADFKVMAVITHPDHLTTLAGLYD
ncbi:MAG: hypothetical protein AAF333_10970 [Planctomycetota bacterium]